MESALIFSGCLILLALWILPVFLGVKAARAKGVSPHWMWFGIHPLGGWIAFLVLRYGITPRKACPRCAEVLKAHARLCAYCGFDFTAAGTVTPVAPSPAPSSANWKLPAIITGSVIAAVLLFGSGIFALVTSLFRHNEAYQMALEEARRNPLAKERLGSPVQTGWWSGSGSIQETGPSGSASLAIPIRGPKGSGTLYLDAEKHAGHWTMTSLELEAPAGQRIRLIPSNTPSPEPQSISPQLETKP